MVAALGEFGKRLAIIISRTNRFFKYRRIGRHAFQPIGLDHRLQPARGDQRAINKIKPGRLTGFTELTERIHGSILG